MAILEEWLWLNDKDVCSMQHLLDISGLSADELEDLIDNGVIAPIDLAAHPRAFRLRYVAVARLARKLRDDFELDRRGMTLAMTLIRRLDEVEAERNELQARLAHTRADQE